MIPIPLRNLNDIPNEGRLLIYGAGGMGRMAVRATLIVGRSPAAHLDTLRNGELDGLPVIRFEGYLADRRPDDVILIASSFVDEIAREIAVLKDATVLDASELLTHLLHTSRCFDRFLTNGRLTLTRG